MKAIFFATLLSVIVFQENINSTLGYGITAGQLLDNTILKLQKGLERLTEHFDTAFQFMKLGMKYPIKHREPEDEIDFGMMGGDGGFRIQGNQNGRDDPIDRKCTKIVRDIYDCTDIKPQKDCLDHFDNGGKQNGLYYLELPGFDDLKAYCDQTTDGGGWIVFQRRIDGLVDFDKKWDDYKIGFGQLENEFWWGNKNIFQLTQKSFPTDKSELLINMRMEGGKIHYVKYETFKIKDEKNEYLLEISNGKTGNFSEDHLNKLDLNNGKKFSTTDSVDGGKCASAGGGGWWYDPKKCSEVWLNAQYKLAPGKEMDKKIRWNNEKLEFVEMKMRRTKANQPQPDGSNIKRRKTF